MHRGRFSKPAYKAISQTTTIDKLKNKTARRASVLISSIFNKTQEFMQVLVKLNISMDLWFIFRRLGKNSEKKAVNA